MTGDNHGRGVGRATLLVRAVDGILDTHSPQAGEGFDCPALDTLFLAAPFANKGSLTQYVGRILRSHENKTTAEVHDYLDERTSVLAAMLAKRAPGYAGLGFPDPRRLALTPSASADS
jgi:hypothetical protein